VVLAPRKSFDILALYKSDYYYYYYSIIQFHHITACALNLLIHVAYTGFMIEMHVVIIIIIIIIIITACALNLLIHVAYTGFYDRSACHCLEILIL